jgi:hypothetical protein
MSLRENLVERPRRARELLAAHENKVFIVKWLSLTSFFFET